MVAVSERVFTVTGSAAIGRVYRETTEEMRLRVVAALEKRLAVALKVAQEKAAYGALPGSQDGESQGL
jgi:hypothetical protein